MDQENEATFTDKDADAYVQEQAEWFYEVLEALEIADLPKLDFFRKSDNNFPDGVDPWIGRHWITNAIDSGTILGVNWILAQNVNLIFRDEEGYTPLHSCISRKKHNKYQIMEALIANGADVNAEGTNGYTPLHLAAVRGDFKAMDILLASGADPKMETAIDNYTTPEEEARLCGNPSSADYLKRRVAEMPKKLKRFTGPLGLVDPGEID